MRRIGRINNRATETGFTVLHVLLLVAALTAAAAFQSRLSHRAETHALTAPPTVPVEQLATSPGDSTILATESFKGAQLIADAAR